MSKYPDNTLIDALRKRGCQCDIAWQIKGPKHTGVAWMEAWGVSHPGGFPTIIIIQTYTGGGWEVYSPGSNGETAATVEDTFQRTRRMPPSEKNVA